MDSINSYLFISSMLFSLGLFGVITRRNAIAVLMGVELILNAANINFVAFSAYLQDLVGQVFAIFVLTIAGAEAAIGLAILVIYYQNNKKAIPFTYFLKINVK